MKGRKCLWKILGPTFLLCCCIYLFRCLLVEKTYFQEKLKLLPEQGIIHNETKVRAGAIKLLQAPIEEESYQYRGDAYNSNAARATSFSYHIDSHNSITQALNIHHAETEVRHIGFVKVHKAASSTMQNIFFRFGKKRSLTFVFTVHPNYFSRNASYPLALVKPKRRSGYDILCNHGVFNKTIYSSILPKDTVYLAIVREPLDLFISSANYYTQQRYRLEYLNRVPGNKLQNLIQNAETYDRQTFSYTRNVLARDLGFPATNDIGIIAKKLKELGETLQLVLLVEYFDESLILMKRYLNWKLGDILYLSNNVYKEGRMSLNDITPGDVEKFKDRNSLDYFVYDFFYEKFWKQFNMETEDIFEEILHFKRVLTKLKTFCNGTEDPGSETLVLDESEWNEPTVVTLEDCKYMKMEELDFIKELRVFQGSELRPVRRVLPQQIRRIPRMVKRS